VCRFFLSCHGIQKTKIETLVGPATVAHLYCLFSSLSSGGPQRNDLLLRECAVRLLPARPSASIIRPNYFKYIYLYKVIYTSVQEGGAIYSWGRREMVVVVAHYYFRMSAEFQVKSVRPLPADDGAAAAAR